MDNLMTDEVIKRRLLVDGDGAGDDRRFLQLMKGYVEFCTDGKLTPDSREGAGRRLLSQAKQAQLAALKTVEAIKVAEEGRLQLETMQGDVKKEVALTRAAIEDSNSLLEKATKHRKHCMEYDALGKLILSKPDRKETAAKRQDMETELHNLKGRLNTLEFRLSKRKKNMEMLSGTLETLQDLLHEEDSQILSKAKGGEDLSVQMETEEAVEEAGAVAPPPPPEAPAAAAAAPAASTAASVGGAATTEPPSGASTAAGGGAPPPADKEKYEDLSESEGEQGE